MSNRDIGNAYLQAEQAFPLAETDEQRAQVYYWRALSQEKMGQSRGAKRDWEALLALPTEAVPTAWRREAQQHLAAEYPLRHADHHAHAHQNTHPQTGDEYAHPHPNPQ